MQSVGPSAGGGGVSKMLSVVAVLLAVVALAINFVVPGPQGASGTNGTDGADGTDGTNGAPGATGAQGPAGPAGADGANGTDGTDGADGIRCWDLNGNGVPDLATEDLNGDGTVDVLDCTGPAGPGAVLDLATGTFTPLTATCAEVNGAAVTLAVPGPGTVVVTATVWVRLEHTAGSPEQAVFLLDSTSADCTDDRWHTYYSLANDEPTGYYINSVFVMEPFGVASAGTYTFYLNARMTTGETANDGILSVGAIGVFYPS